LFCHDLKGSKRFSHSFFKTFVVTLILDSSKVLIPPLATLFVSIEPIITLLGFKIFGEELLMEMVA
jgi:hypothetical protein